MIVPISVLQHQNLTGIGFPNALIVLDRLTHAALAVGHKHLPADRGAVFALHADRTLKLHLNFAETAASHHTAELRAVFTDVHHVMGTHVDQSAGSNVLIRVHGHHYCANTFITDSVHSFSSLKVMFYEKGLQIKKASSR